MLRLPSALVLLNLPAAAVRRAAPLCALLAVSLAASGCRWPWKWPQLSRRNKPAQAEELARQARQAADRGDAASAEFLLAAAVATNPRDCETRLELSEMLLEHGSLSAATEHLKRVVADHPADVRGRVRLAQSLYLQHDLIGAEEQLNLALEHDPAHPQAWLLTARIEHRRGRYKEALSACYRALSADGGLTAAQLLAADLHLALGHPEQATPLLRSLLEHRDSCATERADAAWLLGLCYAREGRWNDAAKTLREAIAQREQSAADWYQLAYASFRAKDAGASRQAVERALALAPGHNEAQALKRLLDAEDKAPTAAASPEPRTAHLRPASAGTPIRD